MPNWCLNNLTVSHEDKSMVDRFVKAYNAGKTCQEFAPQPEKFTADALGRPQSEGDEFGTNGWYGWRVNNWGTKWDIGYDEGTEMEGRHGQKVEDWDNEVSCTFDSAWSPPVGLYDKLVDLGYNVRATYFEPGCAFCGIYEDGFDNTISYADLDDIPDEIREEYNVEEYPHPIGCIDMNIIPINDNNSRFDLVEIKNDSDSARSKGWNVKPSDSVSPHCKIHGAMNCVAVHAHGRLWRCIQSNQVKDCRAGCEEVPKQF
jgi:hypothetical protein